MNSKTKSRRRNPGSSRTPVEIDLLEQRLLLTVVNMTDQEQLILELINRARANPTAEADRYGITLNQSLPAGTISSSPKQPLAPNQTLTNVAVAHSLDMINRDFFDHRNPDNLTPGNRATNAGYDWRTIAENIAYVGYFGAPNINNQALVSHELLFKSAGHRQNILLDSVEEIGVGVRDGAFIPAGSNATLVTEVFGRRNLDPIITGVVFTDSNNSNFYDIGEAVRAGTVTARRVSDGATFTETIGTSGGYGIAVPAGSYVVEAEFVTNGVTSSISTNVTVSVDNVKVDFDTLDVVPVTIALSSATSGIGESGPVSTVAFTITRTGGTSQPLVVSLASDDISEATVPDSITIPAGQTSVEFLVSGVSDTIIDGTQVARITASAPGADAASRNVWVSDKTSPSFSSPSVSAAVTRPVFTWVGIENAATYQIVVTNPAGEVTQIINQDGITSTSFTSPIDLEIANYNVRVRGFTESGQASLWSATAVWLVRPTTAITNPQRTERTDSFTIAWSPIPGAATYEVLVSRLTGGTTEYLRETAVAGTSLDVANFPIGRYQVNVRGRSSAGATTGWSSAALITVSLRVSGLQVVAANFTSLTSLSWNAVNGATQYDVRVDNLSTKVSQFIRNESVGSSSLAMPTLTPGSYRAWVRPKDETGAIYGPAIAFDFKLGRPPQFLSSVASSQPSSPSFAWTQVAGAVRYELVIADPALTPLITESNLTSTQYLATSILPAGSYRAWVRAFNSSGVATSRSSVFTFTIAQQDSDLELAPTMLLDEAFVLFDSLINTNDAISGEVMNEPRATSSDQIEQDSDPFPGSWPIDFGKSITRSYELDGEHRIELLAT